MPTASVTDHVVQFILNRNAVESPDSPQPKPPQAGSCNAVAFTSCPGARNVLAPVCAAVVLGDAVAITLGEETGVAVTIGEAGALGGAEAGGGLEVAATAELLLVEPHAVISKPAHASPAQGANWRALPPFLIHIDVQPLQCLSGSASHVTSTTPPEPPRLENQEVSHGSFGIDITAEAGEAVQGPNGLRSSRRGPLTEALALAPVGRNRGDLVAVDQVVVGEPLGQFAGLGVPQPDPVAGAQPAAAAPRTGVWTSPAPSTPVRVRPGGR